MYGVLLKSITTTIILSWYHNILRPSFGSEAPSVFFRANIMINQHKYIVLWLQNRDGDDNVNKYPILFTGLSFENLSENVQLSPCKKTPCRLKKGTKQHITIGFTPGMYIHRTSYGKKNISLNCWHILGIVQTASAQSTNS